MRLDAYSEQARLPNLLVATTQHSYKKSLHSPS